MTLINNIWGFLKNPQSRTIILLALVFLFASLFLNECKSHKADIAKAQLASKLAAQNDSAENAKIVLAVNKAGDLEATKQSFVTSLADLKKQNDSLYNESKKEIGTLRAIIQTQGTVSTAPVSISNSLIKKADGETYGLAFAQDHLDTTLQWSIAGESDFKLINNVITPGTTTITKNKMSVNLVLGFTEEGTDYKVFARSTSPDVTFNTLNGGLIIPKQGDIVCPPVPAQKRWGIGPFIGVGFGGSNILTPSIFVGIGVDYNLVRF